MGNKTKTRKGGIRKLLSCKYIRKNEVFSVSRHFRLINSGKGL